MSSVRRRLHAAGVSSCVLFAALAALPAAAQPAPAKPAPTSDGLPMPVGKVRHDLGGKVEFDSISITRSSAPRKPIPPEERRPFTAAEILAAAPADRKKPGAKPDGSDAQVLVKQKNPDRETWRPMSAYLAELNAFESWLNGYGYTLRDGALKGPTRAAPGGRPASTRIETDLGLKFALVGLPPKIESPNKGDVPSQYKRLFKWQTIYEPAPRSRGGRVSLPSDRLNVLGTLDGYRVTAPLNAPASRTLSTTGELLQGDFDALFASSAPGLGRAASTTTVQSASCPDAPCTLKYGVEYTLTPKAQSIINNDILFTKYVCDVMNIVATKAEDCGEAGLAATVQTRARDYWPHPEAWLTSYEDVCRWKKSLGLYGFADFYAPAPSYKPDQQTSTGKVEIIKGEKSSHLYKGVLKMNAHDIRDCLPSVSKNFLFGSHACLVYISENSYAPKQPLRVKESAGIDVGVSVFGLDVSLVDGEAAMSWSQPVGVGATVAEPSSPDVAVTNPIVNSSLTPTTNKEYYKGPEGTVLLGPIPLTITSFLEASLNLGGGKESFKAPPLVELIGGKEAPGVGELRMSVGADASVWGGFDAAIDAVIASAGVSGKLSFLETTLGGFVSSKINPADNDVLVEKGYGFTQSSMSGAIDAFVEVDLIVYTKRWSVEIVRFDPVAKLDVPVAVTPLLGYAVDPDTAKPVCE